MNKLIISIFTLLMVAVGAMAQTATVTGTVTDDYGPVIGATVIVQGTTLGCTTDLDGKFTLTNVPDVNKAVLKISFVGMEEVKEPLKGRTSGINIHMTESASMLEDVVLLVTVLRKEVILPVLSPVCRERFWKKCRQLLQPKLLSVNCRAYR